MRNLLVFGDKTFRISVPDDAKVTFGPFSPPTKGQPFTGDRASGTLRIYQGSEKNILACFAGVRGFRDLSMDYAEEVAKEEGATIWKSDRNGYEREEKVSRDVSWIDPIAKIAPPPIKGHKKAKST